MDILLITWNYPPRCGGIENVMANLCAGWQQNHGVAVITAHAQDRSGDGPNVFRAPLAGLVVFALYALWRGALQMLRNPAPQVIFGGSALVTPLVLLLARLFDCKAVVQVHGLDVIYPSALYQQLCARWLGRCDQIVANSSYTASLAQQKGVAPHLITVIPPGVESARFAAAANAEIAEVLGLAGKKIILFVGRLAKRKGVREFIAHALPRIVEKVPNACLAVVGANPVASLAHRDDTLGEIRAEVARQGVRDQVRLLGSLSDETLAQLYRACDLVILPAHASRDDVEGFGIVLLEAAAAGKPAVATRVGGIPDAINEGRSGVLVDPTNYEAMAEAVVELLSDDTKRHHMGEYARQRAQSEFSWLRIAQRYETIFGALLSATRSRSAAEHRLRP